MVLYSFYLQMIKPSNIGRYEVNAHLCDVEGDLSSIYLLMTHMDTFLLN